MLLAHNFRKFQINSQWQVSKKVDKSAGQGQLPQQHLSHCCSTQKIHLAPQNQTPEWVLPAFEGTESWQCPRVIYIWVISIPSTQICRKWVAWQRGRPRYTRLGFLLLMALLFPWAHPKSCPAELSTWGDHPVSGAEGWTCKWPWWRWWSACCPCFQYTCLENKPQACSAEEEQLNSKKWPTFPQERKSKW